MQYGATVCSSVIQIAGMQGQFADLRDNLTRQFYSYWYHLRVQGLGLSRGRWPHPCAPCARFRVQGLVFRVNGLGI